MRKLDAAIRGKNNSRLDDLKYMIGFTHTGQLQDCLCRINFVLLTGGIENINSLQGKYANKHYVYG